MKVKAVAAALVKDQKSGRELDYDPHVLKNNEFRLTVFNREFGETYIHLVKGRAVLNYIMHYKVGPIGIRAPDCFDPKVLHPASRGTKRGLYILLTCLFKKGKRLGALRPHSPTVIERLDCPQDPGRPPQIYLAEELETLVQVQRDIESMLFVAVQAFCGLWYHQALRLESIHIVPRSKGVEPHIKIEKKGLRKDPISGAVKTWIVTAPIPPVLEAFLAQIKLPKGRIFVSKSIQYKVRRAAEAAGLRWKRAGLRNLFIARRLAAGHDPGQVAYEAGIRFEEEVQHLVGLVDQTEARAYSRIKLDPGTRPYTAERLSWKTTTFRTGKSKKAAK